MKINQVEELVGITKKNIRFYEDQGLICPNRNPENGYREYSLEDVETLSRIRLLRSLDVPIEQIRNMQTGVSSFEKCMEEQFIRLSHRQHELERTKEICKKLSEEVHAFSEIESAKYFDVMKKMEEGGIFFMDARQTDVKKRSAAGAIIAAAIVMTATLFVLGFIIWGYVSENMPVGILLYFLIGAALVLGGISYALLQRIKEIKGGEADEARKY